jgi:tetratricopeptide (TPR) repeat protein
MRKVLSLVIVGFFASHLTASAQKNVEPVFSKTSPQAEALFKQGLQLADQGDVRQARKLFLQAAEKDPKFASAYIYLTAFSQSAKEAADNIAKAKANLDAASEWDKLYYATQQSYFTDDWNVRLATAQKMVSTFPTSARALVELGNAYGIRNDSKNEREAFMKAIALAPNWPTGYISLASSYSFEEPKDFNKAEEYAVKATQKAPTSAAAQILLGDVYRAQKKLEKARDAYTAAIALQSDDPAPYYKRGHANTYLGDFDAARKDYGDGGKYDDLPAFAALNIAYTYLYDNDVQKAYDALLSEEGKLDGAKDPMSNEAKLNLLYSSAFIGYHTNDADKVSTIISKMEPLVTQMGEDIGTPEAKLTQKANMLYWKAIAEALKGNFDEASKSAEDMKTTLAPINNPRKLESYASVKGFIDYKQNKYDVAIKDFQEGDKNDVYTKYWLARSYEAAGNKDEANKIYKDIADYNFNGIGYALIRSEVKKKVAGQ